MPSPFKNNEKCKTENAKCEIKRQLRPSVLHFSFSVLHFSLPFFPRRELCASAWKSSESDLLRHFRLVEDLAKALVSPSIKTAVSDGIFDRTICFVCVRAVVEPARIDVWPQVAKVASHFFRNYIPQLKLPDAGGVENISAAEQRD
jgi:hypothetical protein